MSGPESSRGSLSLLAAVLVAAAVGVSAPPARAEDPVPRPKVTFRVDLLALEPVSGEETRRGELFFAGVRAEWRHAGFAAVAELRGTEDRFRPYFRSGLWLEEGYAGVETPVGEVRLGKLQRRFGPADESFAGTLASRNGLSRNPDYGLGLAGEKRLGWDTLTWWAAFFGQNDRVAFEEDGFGIESDPSARLRGGLEGRVTYLVNHGLTTLRPGLSVASSEIRWESGSFRRTDLGADLVASLGPLSATVSGFRRSGVESVVERLGYQDAWGGLLGFVAEFPNVVFRYSYSEWRFPGSGAVHREHLPSVSWAPVRWARGTIEYGSLFTRDARGERTESAFRFGLALEF